MLAKAQINLSGILRWSARIKMSKNRFPADGATFVPEMALPFPDTHKDAALCLQHFVNEIPIQVICEPVGRLRVRVIYGSGDYEDTVFRQLIAVPYGVIKIAIAFDGGTGYVTMAAGGELLEQDPDRALPAKHLKLGCCRYRGHRPKLFELSRTVSD
ncbi:hypothetical protein [Lacisediminimonas profundi]|uniref:hypothetical protein n=1 Tax=Lacisediminimonas profundi TaxID=2603856 RepID=UPI00124BB86D|nr:hypothetical protein [Lacisediminimonas profundi]